MSLLPSNLSSLGYFDVVGDKSEEECLWVLALVELDNVLVEVDADLEREVGWRRYGFFVEVGFNLIVGFLVFMFIELWIEGLVLPFFLNSDNGGTSEVVGG